MLAAVHRLGPQGAATDHRPEAIADANQDPGVATVGVGQERPQERESNGMELYS